MATVKELREQAKKFGIKGYSKMRKEELARACSNALWDDMIATAKASAQTQETTQAKPKPKQPKEKAYLNYEQAVEIINGIPAGKGYVSCFDPWERWGIGAIIYILADSSFEDVKKLAEYIIGFDPKGKTKADYIQKVVDEVSIFLEVIEYSNAPSRYAYENNFLGTWGRYIIKKDPDFYNLKIYNRFTLEELYRDEEIPAEILEASEKYHAEIVREIEDEKPEPKPETKSEPKSEAKAEPEPEPEPETKKDCFKFEIGKSYGGKENYFDHVFTVIERGENWILFQDEQGKLYYVRDIVNIRRGRGFSYERAERLDGEDCPDLQWLTSDHDELNNVVDLPKSNYREITETTAQYLPALPEIPEATLQDEAPALPEIPNQAQKPQADDHAPALPEKPREIKSWPVISLTIIIAITHKQGIIFYTPCFLKITNPKPPP